MKHLIPLLFTGFTASLLAQQPNILLIMADDVDVEAFQAYVTNPVNTADSGAIVIPNIDTLASQGVRFTNAFTEPLCTPTRCMLLTGQANIRNYRAFGYLDNDQTTFAQVLRANGYTTAIAGKWQLSDPDGDTPITPSGVIAPNVTPAILRDDYGFDSYLLWQLNHTQSNRGSRYWQPKLETASGDGLSSVLVSTSPTDYGPDLFTAHLKDFITDSAASSTPFLAYYAMALPHDPWVSTPDAPGATTGDDEIYFDENIEYIDKLVGELVAHLDDPDGNPGTSDSIRDNTIIIFTADNGTSPRVTINNSERGNVTGDKGTASYDGTHVPFILSWSGTTAAAVSTRMLDLSDVFPTILEVAGITPDPGLILDGQPIINASGTVLDNKPASYIWYDPKGRAFPTAEFAQNQQYKLYADGRLYRIDSDFLETTNLNDGSLTTEEQAAVDALSAVIASFHPTEPVPDRLAPDDPSISDGLRIWLKDAGSNYTPGTWNDASGYGNDVIDTTGIFGFGGSFGVEALNPAAGPFSGKTVNALRLDDNHLMGAAGINGGTGFSDLTIISIYKVTTTGSGTRPVGIGSKTVEGTTDNYDRFNLATDPSIRYDDGSNVGGLSHPTSLVLRATRLTGGNTVSDWIDSGSGLALSLDEVVAGSGSSSGTAAPSFQTQNDDLYLGELSANVGVDNPSTATYHFAQVAVYNTALSDAQIASIAEWMRTFPEGNPTYAQSWRLTWFGQIENTGDAADDFDYDKDGLINLLERAFNSDPTLPGVAGILPTSATVDATGNPGSDYLALSYRQLGGGSGTVGVDYSASGITYTVEHDDNLSDPWSTGAISVLNVVDNGDGTKTASVRLNEPVATPGKQFIRLNVSEIP
jgi:arylsulfatase A-like enzyme